ncbi:MAG TPA: hypothetical protein VH475_27495 [Tepidisphaeraceae bacterium]
MSVPVNPSTSRDRTLYSLRALGRADLPAQFSLGGVTYRHERTIKHDFFAATGFYLSPDGERVVLKVGRTADYAGLPLTWLGRWLCERESRFYQACADLPNVPKWLGNVGVTGFAHAYVPGRPLSKEHPIPDGMFDELFALLAELHRRKIAYVDTNKPQNILQGEDGRPHLIDFQISFGLADFGDNFLTRAILRRLQKEDRYHVLKHKRKLRPDLLTAEERARAGKISWFIKAHRWVTRPYFLIRRRTFRRLERTGQVAPEGSK